MAEIVEPGMAEARLSRRERQVCNLLADGFSNDQIAARLFVSRDTVKTHVRRIMSKYPTLPGKRNALIPMLRRWGYGSELEPLPRLTPREAGIVRLLSQGMGTKEIGATLELSPLTVKSHLARIARKCRERGSPWGVLVARMCSSNEDRTLSA